MKRMKNIYIRDCDSSPPSHAQLDYLHKVKTEIALNKNIEDNRRIAVRVSSSSFVLCDPEEEQKYSEK